MNRLFACSNIPGEKCYSWKFLTGEKETHPALNIEPDSYCGVALTEINGKIWITGGNNDRKTAFLQANFTWTKGPDLPEDKSYHVAIAIDRTRAVIFGDFYSPDVWLYDDAKRSFEIRAPYDIGNEMTAGKLADFNEIGNDVILVLDNYGHMATYDWENDSWMRLDDSWALSKEMFFNSALVQVGKRYA